MKFGRIGAALAAAISFIFVNTVQASTVYNYAGPTFNPTSIADDPLPAGSYTSSMNVSGSFTVAGPLINFSGLLTPLSFSFSDGRNTITDLTAYAPDTSFNIQTDTSGNIVFWSIGVGRYIGTVGILNVGDQFIGISTVGVGGTSFGDVAQFDERVSANSIGQDSATIDQDGGPASWSSPTPIPATLPLFATGLGALGLLGWRRKRKLT